MKRRTGNSMVARVLAAVLATAVVATSIPATVLADEEVTVESVKTDESNAESAVSEASDSIPVENNTTATVKVEVKNEDGSSTETDKTVTSDDVRAALQEGQNKLDLTEGNINNIEQYMKELQSVDSEGKPIGLIPDATNSASAVSTYYKNNVKPILQPVLDQDGNPVLEKAYQVDDEGKLVVDDKGTPIPLLDENNNPVLVPKTELYAVLPVYVQRTDANGNPLTDEDGNPLYVQQTDAEGKPMFDKDGNPIYVQELDEEKNPVTRTVKFDEISGYTTGKNGSANGAISNAGTANTSNSESVARAAAQSAHEDLEVAERGLLDAGQAISDGEKVVEDLEAKLKTALEKQKAAQDKYDALKAELSTGTTNATAANEQLKAAEKYVNALKDAAQKQYEEYIKGKNSLDDNIKLLETIDECNKALDKYRNEDGSFSEKNLDDIKNFIPTARKLSIALLEYYIKNEIIQAVDYTNAGEDKKGETVGYAKDLLIGDKFKVTLKSYSVPDPITADDIKDGKVKLNEINTEYELSKTGWKDGNILEEAFSEGILYKGKDDKGATMDSKTGWISAGKKTADEGKRVVVSFADTAGNKQDFYFNYKINLDDGTVYIYQRTFEKATEEKQGNSQAFLVSEGETIGYYKNGSQSDENNINNLNLEKHDVIVDKDENTKLFVHTGPAGEVHEYKVKDKQEKPRDAEQVKITEVDERGHSHEKDKEEVEYSIVNYKGQEIVKKTVYKFYYEVTKNIIQEFDEFTRENLTKDGMVNEISNTLISKGVKDHIDIKTGNGNGPQYFYVRSSDGTTTMYTVIVSNNGNNNYSYKMDVEIYKEEKTEKRYIADNSKGYNIKETYTAVKSDPVYAGYDGYTNEIGIQWEDDKFTPVAQERAVTNDQLKKDENGKYTNNFDYLKALEYKHLYDNYVTAAAKVNTASGYTKTLEDDIKKLKILYNGYQAEAGGNQEENKEPDNELYSTLTELAQEIADLQSQLQSAKITLAFAKKEKANLEEKVEEARKAVAGIDLSRFNRSEEDDDDDDGDDSGSPSTTPDEGGIIISEGEIPVIPIIPTTGTPSGVAGVRTGRRSGVAGIRVEADGTGEAAETTAANKTVAASEKKVPVDPDDFDKDGSKKLVKVGDNMVPLADTPFEEGMNMNWLWLLVVAAAVIVTIYAYENHKKKVAANEEAKKYKK